jgi:hypothetical protein
MVAKGRIILVSCKDNIHHRQSTMVCTQYIRYFTLGTNTNAKTSVTATVSVDPPEEIAGKTCQLKLVHGETAYVSPGGRFPLEVTITGPSFTNARQSDYALEPSTGTQVISDSQRSSVVGYMALNDSGGITNPSLTCYIPPGPQTWTVKCSQLNVATGYLDTTGFTLSLVLQIAPITNS